MDNKENNPIAGNSISRRTFLSNSALATAGIMSGCSVIPGTAASGLGHTAPSDRLNIAGVGVGGKGFGLLRAMESENIVALCDVDWNYAKDAFDYFENAAKYMDWRKMLDEMGDQIDAVVIATSDHTHAVIAAHAMTLGKHVYVEKPLTHSIYEARLLTKLAEEYQVVTQMGNQGASEGGTQKVIDWVRRGEIGEVTKVESFTDRPIWPQGLERPAQGMWVPDTLDWDSFIGPAKMRPYHPTYTPWNFRGWWDFGTGALGDMAAHILHGPFMGLNLGYPIKAQGSSSLLYHYSAPNTQRVNMTFPERNGHPQVEINWYDGGLQPLKPEGWPAGRSLNHHGGGVLFYGSEDILYHGCYGRVPMLLSGREPDAPEMINNLPDSHEMDWVNACKENRTDTFSPFSEAGPFTEMLLMGVLSVRLQHLNKELEWDGESMEFTNIHDNETIQNVLKDDFYVEDGDPTFTRETTDDINAKAFAEELIKHEYREGWSLPDMPS